MLRRVSTFVIGGLLSAMVFAQTPPRTSNQMELVLSPQRQGVDHRILFDLYVRNLTDSIFRMSQSSDVRVERDGHEAVRTQWYASPASQIVTVSAQGPYILPGRSESQRYDVGDYYELKQPGTYEIYVQMRDPAGTLLRSNVAILNVDQNGNVKP